MNDAPDSRPSSPAAASPAAAFPAAASHSEPLCEFRDVCKWYGDKHHHYCRVRERDGRLGA